jgi:hypothetical protein
VALSAASLTAENLGSFRKERRSFLPLRRLPKAYTGSATVFVDELDAAVLQTLSLPDAIAVA